MGVVHLPLSLFRCQFQHPIVLFNTVKTKHAASTEKGRIHSTVSTIFSTIPPTLVMAQPSDTTTAHRPYDSLTDHNQTPGIPMGGINFPTSNNTFCNLVSPTSLAQFPKGAHGHMIWDYKNTTDPYRQVTNTFSIGDITIITNQEFLYPESATPSEPIAGYTIITGETELEVQ